MSNPEVEWKKADDFLGVAALGRRKFKSGNPTFILLVSPGEVCSLVNT